MERIDTYALAAAGLAKGVFEVYVRPIPGDLLRWAAGRLISFEVPSEEDITAHIQAASIQYYSTGPESTPED